jgi:hypothetical protein
MLPSGVNSVATEIEESTKNDTLTWVVGVAIGAQVVDADARAYLYLTRNASVWVCLVYVETVDVSTDMENDFERDCEEEG